jgi:hypothetical protein
MNGGSLNKNRIKIAEAIEPPDGERLVAMVAVYSDGLARAFVSDSCPVAEFHKVNIGMDKGRELLSGLMMGKQQ